MTNFLNSNFVKWLGHSILLSLLIEGLGYLIAIHPAWTDVTLFSAITMAYNWFISVQTNVGFAIKIKK